MPRPTTTDTAEHRRLEEDAARDKNWKRWGPYLAERQWGTVREDYSADGSVWDYFPHDHARSRAYRWGEDGLLGLTDRQCRLCFSVALWNGKDPILKERLFGLTGPEGNHGEDVKELYYYLDATPTSSYAKALYKYPQAEYPYDKLLEENADRDKQAGEYEITDTGVFDEGRYFDVQAEYAKADDNDVLIRITVTNHGPEEAELHLIPQFWFRNTWVWGCEHEGCTLKPRMKRVTDSTVVTDHQTLGQFTLRVGPSPDGSAPPLLFTDNDTNFKRLWDTDNPTSWCKDAFHDRIIHGDETAINAKGYGTKVGAWHRLSLPPGESRSVQLRFHEGGQGSAKPRAVQGDTFDTVFAKRIEEADAFYASVMPGGFDAAQRNVARQSYAGLLWTKQFYHYIIDAWLDGDPHMVEPPPQRKKGRNADWRHLFNRDVISMPDKWEYPWYAAWDLAFHMLPFAAIDPAFAKGQLRVFLREWYMHPNGQIPAYEFNFSDVNPPVHAWACWRVFKMTGPRGGRDRKFLAGAFQKMLLNFTWWVNRKDPGGNHLFSGGFLGLDNIGVFDRNTSLGPDVHLEQSDGTAWMAFFCLTMLDMAIELAQTDHGYSDMASKFFEHFVQIADAMNHLGGDGLWDEDDGFYYDQLWHKEEGRSAKLKVRSLVGLLPLIACSVIERSDLESEPLAGFRKRTNWFLENRKDLARSLSYLEEDAGDHERFLLAIPSRDRLERVLAYMLDENEFLSPFGIRSLSKYHEKHPYVLELNGQRHEVRYTPGESDTTMFGGNSNWRGPVWFPVNYLIIESLQRYHRFFGDDLTVECPTGSGNRMNLEQVTRELQRRLTRLFLQENGSPPCLAHPPDSQAPRLCDLPGFENLLLFHEYFHGDTGRGLGASHQTGWTALVIKCLEDVVEGEGQEP